MTRIMTSFGTATQPPVQGFCGPKQCRKIAEPRPGAPFSRERDAGPATW